MGWAIEHLKQFRRSVFDAKVGVRAHDSLALVHDVPTLWTTRLTLRAFRDSDRPPFAELNADLEVMRHFPAVLSRSESDDLVDRIGGGWSKGFGLWAVERRDAGAFVGFIGLSEPSWSAHFTPCIEIGWRLSQESWGHGFATEGADEVLSWAREHVVFPHDEVVSFTAAGNRRSRRVMEKLGMTRDAAEDFDHPLVTTLSLRRHVLYRKRM